MVEMDERPDAGSDDKIKENLTKVVVIRVTEDVGQRLENLAYSEDRSLSWVCRRAIEEWLAEGKDEA